jgi:D-serine deaminase-like pyridoxal phosphate-dependent protein
LIADAPWQIWRTLLAGCPLPAAIVDLDAVLANARLLTGLLAPGVTLRIASKSLRIPALMHRLLADDPERIRGVMTFSARETEALAADGFDDLFLAYPPSRPDEAAALAGAAALGRTVRIAIDDARHVGLLSEAAVSRGVRLAVALDLDTAWRPLGPGLHLGVWRSPLREIDAVRRLADAVAQAPGLVLDGLLAYEAQVAGLSDAPRGKPLMRPVIAAVKAGSRPRVAALRRATAAALRADGHAISVINGGGSGSVAATSGDGTVTEVTAGSGFLAPHLFDNYDRLPLVPAAFFALAVSRLPDADHVTCASGGFVASGPAGEDRLPQIHAPAGLLPLSGEGWGEVQTPLRRGPGAPRLAIGDPVIARHAKAGELFERFTDALLIERGALREAAATYRGRGWSFG